LSFQLSWANKFKQRKKEAHLASTHNLGIHWPRGLTGVFCILKNTIAPHCVMKWCNSVRIVIDPENTLRVLLYDVLHDMVSLISKSYLGYTIFEPGIKRRSSLINPKQNSWVVDHMLLSKDIWSCFEQIYSKKWFCHSRCLVQFWP
jgi:hypothetical protein